ncbi:MAG: hypothetical protein OEW48_11795 [Phycisphaerae bacterium]|nr:hypothetical protein [Phycisphaerae bacterium]
MRGNIITIMICMTTVQFAVAKNPSVLELLDKYAETQDQFQSFMVKISTIHRSVSKELMARQPWQGRYSTECDARFDKGRASVCVRSWGKINRTDYYKKDKPYYTSDLWDGENHFQYTEAREKPVLLSIGGAKVTNMRDGVIKQEYSGKFLMGYFFPFSERVDSILRKAGKLSVRRTTEMVGRSPCYVIEGAYEKDKYKIWMDPEHGFHIAKAVVERAQSNVQDSFSFRVELKNVHFQKIDGKWVPVSANLESRFDYQKGQYSNSSYHIKVTEMVFDPDHDALGSFVPGDIKDRTWVPFFVDSQSPYYPQYFWSKEPKVVADRKRRLLRYKPDGSMFPVIKTLPKFDVFDLKFEPDETKDKIILLCFFDIKQASQEYAFNLAERASKLAEKDVLVIFVDAAGSEKKQVDTWAKQHSIKVGVGRLHKEILKRIRKAWGIETLPRLVLTDRNHVIVAEGFALEELEGKIKEAAL